ncbi:hypothetical protein KEM56_000297 [Ascosphaera pollenicola]|nr:hypothetical protein KEM56_000297 [Ascosphaera pollenicola]
MAQHAPGGNWSSRNPVPKISKLAEHLKKRDQEKQREEQEEAQRHDQKEPEKPQEGQDVDGGEAKPHPETTHRRRYRRVTDPTTGREVEIDDVDKDFLKAVKNETSVKTSPDQSMDDYKQNQDITAPPDPIASGTTSDVPIHGEKTNVLFYPTPSITYDVFFKQLEKRTYAVCGGCAVAILVIGKMGGASLKTLFILSIGITCVVYFWMMDLIQKGRANEWANEMLRGQTATANLLPESAEWINSFLSQIWGIIDPEVFSSIGDTIEDIMQSSVPSLIENVRVAQIDQGSNPLRILSMRALPDSHVKDLKEGNKKHTEETSSADEAAATREIGAFYNLEASFAYHAKPSGSSSASKAENIHMLLVFYLGIKSLFGVPLPIFVELIEFVGTVRVRLQVTPDPPFAKSCCLSLMGLPHIKAGCTPMVKRGINILKLPVISNFVNYAIATAASLYVAPKSMSIDVGKILQGDDIQKDTDAFGILWVRIHKAKDLSKQDARGSVGGGSDPYINLSFSKYGKPMYCTRVIIDDRNPVWEEAAALLVTAELIRADEELSVELWDSDRTTADDIVGKITLPIKNMIERPGKMFSVTSKLSGVDEGSEMPGELLWEVGFFGKPSFRKSMRTDGKNHNLPENMEDRPELQDEVGKIDSEEDDAVVHTPPDPIWPSGICNIVIHQIVNLELEEIKGTYQHRKNHEYDSARKYGENKEETGDNLPTSYCSVHMNDALIHRTRSKAVTSNPIFNTSMEHFVRDWRSAVITVTVRDKRYRQHDPILGVVPLKLTDILRRSSQKTRWYSLDGGIGFGRIRISVLFRSVEINLAPPLLGWDVGTFQVLSDRINAHGYHDTGKLTLHTTGVTTSISRSSCYNMDDGNGKYYVVPHHNEAAIILPLQHRFRSAIVFELHGSTKGWATLWLKDFPDNDAIDVDIPIWEAKMHARLTENYITEDNYEEKRYPGLEDLEIIGRLKFKFRFAAGLHEVFSKHIKTNEDRETFETWEACISEGIRDREVSNKLPEEMETLLNKSLIANSDILRYANEEERKRWLEDTGVDKMKFMRGDTQAIETVDRKITSGSRVPDQKIGSSHSDESKGKGEELRKDKEDTELNFIHSTNDDGAGDGSVSRGQQQNHGQQVNQKQSQDTSRQHAPDAQQLLSQDTGSRPLSGASSQLNGHSNGGDSSGQDSNNSSPSGKSSQWSAQTNGSAQTAKEEKKRARRTERRKHRGMMQWKPARNAEFLKDETKFAFQKVKTKLTGGLQGREPDVETETG